MSVFEQSHEGTPPPSVVMRKVIEIASQLSNQPEANLRGHSRVRELTHQRHLTMLACRVIAKASLPQIGLAFGGRDHTSVIYACKVAKKRADWAADLKQIRAQLEAAR